jgi:hypothetical protein
VATRIQRVAMTEPVYILTAQLDAHVTIQNKAAAQAARTLHAALTQDFQMRTGSACGLQVFEYLGGPWQLTQSLPFEPAPAE